MSDFHHKSVMAEEAVAGLNPHAGGVYVDCTLGGAGHSARILERSSPDGFLIGIDQDPQAIAHARNVLQPFAGRFTLVHSNFRHLRRIVQEDLHIPAVDGVLFDLGVSSPQLDQGERGFSYQQDAPLDMRMDPEQPFSAFALVNSWSEEDLARILWEYGEERFAKRIASRIVQARNGEPIRTTGQLVEIIKEAIPAPARRAGPHPAKRTFQAIRIAVNDELNAFAAALQDAVHLLKPGGRVAVITFHSLEDRIAKQIFQERAKDCLCPPEFPVCQCHHHAEIRLVTRKPILPSAQELKGNPRARSAKLRVAEKISD